MSPHESDDLGSCVFAGGVSGGHRYGGDVGGLGLYSKGMSGLDGSWTRGSSYSDIRSMGYHHRTDPVYEEIEKPMSPRASVSDLSEDEVNLYPHDLDMYNRSLYGQQVRSRATIKRKLHFPVSTKKKKTKGETVKERWL